MAAFPPNDHRPKSLYPVVKSTNSAKSPTTPGGLLPADVSIAKEMEIDGIGMGVLSDGTPYLTGRGLARMCGIDNATLVETAGNWASRNFRPREMKIIDILGQEGAALRPPYIEIQVDGTVHNAYADAVCMAFLEYYAFEAGSNCKAVARENYRLLARQSFREYIYAKVGYRRANDGLEVWTQFHDRVSLNYETVPPGYFSIFKEAADIIVSMISAGADIGKAFVPDISIGQHWSRHWKSSNLSALYGERQKYEHAYPEYFPQAESNPQTPFCYPDAALGEFRRWMREVYRVQMLPRYLESKIQSGQMPGLTTRDALKAISPR